MISGFFVKVFSLAYSKIREKDDENVPENRINKIVALITENNTISIPLIAHKCGVTEKTIKRDLEKLKDQNKHKRIGPNKGGYWEIINRS